MRHSDEYYSGIAPGYDALYGAEQDAKLLEFLGHVEPSGILLDVGCGTGRSAALLPAVRWYGVEPAAGLISHAPAELRPRIKQGVGEALPFPEASFDAVLSLTALQNYDDPAAGLAEMLRVCVPGGLLLVSFLKASPKAALLDALVRRILPVAESWEQAKDMMYVCWKQKL